MRAKEVKNAGRIEEMRKGGESRRGRQRELAVGWRWVDRPVCTFDIPKCITPCGDKRIW